VTTPGLDDDDGLQAASKPLEADALVAQRAVDALVRSVLPRLARIDEGAADALVDDPLQYGLADDLGPLSERRCAGAPCTLTSFDSSSTTRLDRMLLATSIARHS
jgi:hypothetical protein